MPIDLSPEMMREAMIAELEHDGMSKRARLEAICFAVLRQAQKEAAEQKQPPAEVSTRINNQSASVKFVLTNDDTIVGSAVSLANGRWGAYDVSGRNSMTEVGITFETPEDVAAFFALAIKGVEQKHA